MRQRLRRRCRPRLLAHVRRRPATLVVLVCVALTTSWMSSATDAAFTASTSTPATAFTAGSVTITDDDAGVPLTLSGLVPGQAHSSCIRVSYSGTLPAGVKLHRTTGGTGLAPYLDVSLTRGSLPAGPPGDCTGFAPDAVDYRGKGAGILYQGTLGAFPDAVGAALDDPRGIGVPEVWTAGETHAYRLTVTVQDDQAAQGLTVTGGLVWQAADVSGYPGVVLADGPVGYWQLDETGGTTAVDSTGHGHDGTYSGAPALGQVSGVEDAGAAVTFDGADDRVDVPWAATLNPSVFTVEAWARSTGGSGWRTVVTSWGAAFEGFGVWAAPSGEYQFWVNGPADETGIPAAQALTSWAHVVGTYDGTTMRIYVDGQLVSSAVHAYAPHTTAALGIGATSYDDGTSWGEHFTGSIDEVAVYDRALSPQEILRHYEAGTS